MPKQCHIDIAHAPILRGSRALCICCCALALAFRADVAILAPCCAVALTLARLAKSMRHLARRDTVVCGGGRSDHGRALDHRE